MLEASDMNDSAILAATTQKVNTQGQKQLSLTLPSGRVITSEWLPADARAGALITWCEAVRSQAVADEKEAAAKARRGSIAVEPATQAAAAAGTPTTRCAQAKAIATGEIDALSFAKSQVSELTLRVREDEAAALIAAANAKHTRSQLEQWTKILSSLEGNNV